MKTITAERKENRRNEGREAIFEGLIYSDNPMAQLWFLAWLYRILDIIFITSYTTAFANGACVISICDVRLWLEYNAVITSFNQK